MKEKVLPAFYPRVSGTSQELFLLTLNVATRETPTKEIFGCYMQRRQASDDGAARLPFSDYYNPNELPRLPSPSHGEVGCVLGLGRERFNFVGYLTLELEI